MKSFSEFKSWASNRKKEDFVVLALVGILLVIISIPVSGSSGKNSGEPQKEETMSMEDEEKLLNVNELKLVGYIENLENQLEETLQQIYGVGKVHVMINIDQGERIVVEKDMHVQVESLQENDAQGGTRSQETKDSVESTLFVQNGQGESQPYVVQKILPKVSGVVVVAQGSGNILVKQSIIQAVQVLFDIDEHKIKVIKMKS